MIPGIRITGYRQNILQTIRLEIGGLKRSNKSGMITSDPDQLIVNSLVGPVNQLTIIIRKAEVFSLYHDTQFVVSKGTSILAQYLLFN
jgi:hypothetical protein